MTNKTGLVLSGGAAKGAYQIGVFRALKKFDVIKNLYAVSGTSVGTLNAVLLSQDDLQLAEKIWMTLTTDRDFYKDLYMTKKHSMFTQSFLSNILNKYIDLSLVSKSQMRLFTTCCRIPSFEPVSFCLNECAKQDLECLLHASVAIPGISRPVNINGKKYVDGFIRRNIPVRAVYQEGCNQIIIVHFDAMNPIDHSLFPDAEIIEIVFHSSKDYVLKKSFDFRPGNIRPMIEKGYDDAIKILGDYYKVSNAFKKQNKLKNAVYINRDTALQTHQCSIRKQTGVPSINCDIIVDKLNSLFDKAERFLNGITAFNK